VNAQVKITRDAVRAALQDAQDAARVGGLRRDETLAILRGIFGDETLNEPKARREGLRGKLVEFRDAARKNRDAESPGKLKAAVAEETAARAELERIDAARVEAVEHLRRARDRLRAVEIEQRRPVDEDNLLLERTADPAIDRFVALLEREFDRARSRPALTRPDRFVADDKAIAADKGKVVRESIPEPRNPMLITVDPTEYHKQVGHYLAGLQAACAAAEELKLTAVAGEPLLAALERIEKAIPYRDRADIVETIRNDVKANLARGQS
jgi:hypothetical protein